MIMNRERFFIPIFVSMAFAFAFSVAAATGDVTIAEVLFDASGDDTGAEYIVIKNFGNDSINLIGWDLYPDGAGYFTFPGFILPSGALVKIHLRASGTNDEMNLYHSAATGNMGNSSGSVALFSSTDHSKDTIVSYLRYQKSGSTERKTWESAASSAGIWTTGTFVDISQFSEGQILSLKNFDERKIIGGWEIKSVIVEQTSSSTEVSNNLVGSSSSTSSNPDNFSAAGSGAPPRPENKIKASAGTDRSIIAGGEIFFDGIAEGLKGEPIPDARFLWNFGDGTKIIEGKKASHVFPYPGNYVVDLEASSGEYLASDYVKIAVSANPLVISELEPGANGWVEIKNDSNKKIEISRFGLSASATNNYFFPTGTFLMPYSFLVVGTSTLGFSFQESGEVNLLYPNGSKVLSIAYQNAGLAEGESISLINDDWVKTKATPGEANPKLAISKKIIATETKVKTTSSKEIPQVNSVVDNKNNLTASVLDSSEGKKFSFGEYLWLLIGAGAGLVGGLIFVLAKRYLV